ncbi:MAG: septum formation initiator family protein [Syntrophotaleaceae bacterium]
MPEENPTPRARFKMPLVPMLLILIILGVALFGEKGILRALQASRHKSELETELQRQEELIRGLKKEVEALRSDREFLEGIARRELGMVKEDELVYQFPKNPTATSQPNP